MRKEQVTSSCHCKTFAVVTSVGEKKLTSSAGISMSEHPTLKQ